MYDVIKKYAENGNSNGLMLIDMPTGSGKTYSAVKYIFDACQDEQNAERKYIFVTTLKKNLPNDDLKKRFADIGRLDLFKDKVLLIDSNMDAVINGWSNDIDKMIPWEIKKCEEYVNFSRDIRFVKYQRDRHDSKMKEYTNAIEANLREKSEPLFRKLISEYLTKEHKTVDEKLQAIKTDKEWQWISSLYPAVFTRDKQILLMSMDKFLSRNTTIVEPSYLFYNSELINNAVIFIDEFDATKDTVLKNIINNGLRDRIDYIELFKDIYAALHTDEFPTVLVTPSTERQNGQYKNQSLDSIVEKIREKADYIYKTFSLQFKHIEFYGEASEAYSKLIEDVEGAHSFIYLEYFAVQCSTAFMKLGIAVLTYLALIFFITSM